MTKRSSPAGSGWGRRGASERRVQSRSTPSEAKPGSLWTCGPAPSSAATPRICHRPPDCTRGSPHSSAHPGTLLCWLSSQLLSGFNLEGYIPLIMKMEKRSDTYHFFCMSFIAMFDHMLSEWQCLASCCQDDSEEAHLLGISTWSHSHWLHFFSSIWTLFFILKYILFERSRNCI